MKKLLITVSLLITILIPVAFVSAQAPKLDYGGFVNCDGVVTAGEEGRKNKCDFADLIALVQKMINWLFYISIPIATVLFAYAGLLHLSGKESNIKQSWAIFQAVAIGFIIMLVAWFGISTLLQWFAKDSSGATTLIGK